MNCYYILSYPLPLEPAYGRNTSPKISDDVWIVASRQIMIPGVVDDVKDDTVIVNLVDGHTHRFNKKAVYPRDPSKHD
jgi:hypothetical protein